MGQVALGILYGCEAPAVDAAKDPDGEFWYDLADKFSGPCDWRKPTPRIRHEIEGGKDLIGVWVAVGGSGEDGAPGLPDEAMPMDDFAKTYRESIVRAEKLWVRFVAHCQKQGILLPSATLWLTPCEVA